MGFGHQSTPAPPPPPPPPPAPAQQASPVVQQQGGRSNQEAAALAQCWRERGGHDWWAGFALRQRRRQTASGLLTVTVGQ